MRFNSTNFSAKLRIKRLARLHLLALTSLLVPAFAQAFDADADGASDEADAFPCQSQAAAVVFAPAQGDHGLLLFEDQWPSHGDLDFNDLVLSHNFIFQLNAQGQVLSLRATFNALALGGVFHNGLAFRLPVATSAAASVRRTIGQGPTEELSPVSSDPQLTVRVADNLRQLFDNQEGTLNSDEAQPTRQGLAVEIEVVFSTPVALDTGLAPFDTFIFRTENVGHEIHRPEFSGSASMDSALFGSEDDRSSPSRHFVDSQGLPFVLNLPSLLPWAKEGHAIDLLYPELVGFASSAGAQNRDFYQHPVQAHGYRWPQPAPADDIDPSHVPWQTPVSPIFIGPTDIPADTACVNAWGLSVQFGSSRDTFGYGSTLDAAGDVLVTGYTSGSFAGFTSAGAQDLFVAKYNRAAGTLLWAQQLGGLGSETGRAVATDSAGNIYVVGETRSNLQGRTNAGQYDAFLMKLDPTGAPLWTRLLGGSGYDYGSAVAVSPSGAVFIAGGSTSANLAGSGYQGTSASSYVARFDSSGALQWVRQLQADDAHAENYSYISSLALDSSDNVYAAGSERRYNRHPSAAENQFLLKLDSAGARQWTQHIGDYGLTAGTSNFRYAHASSVTVQGQSVYVTGHWKAAGPSNASWAGWTRSAGDSSTDITLVQVSTEGALQWSRSVGSSNRADDYAQSVTTDSSANAYVVGYTAGLMTGSTLGGSFDSFVTRYSPAGVQSWLVQTDTSSDDAGFGASLDPSDGALYTVGNVGAITGNPSAFADRYYGYIARHPLTTGARSSFVYTATLNPVFTTCQTILASGAAHGSGRYTIDPDGSGPNAPFDAYCEMSDDGGGWTLMSKVNPADQTSLPEPGNFFNLQLRPELMSSPALANNAGLASLGAYRFVPAISTASVIKFEFIAEDDFNQRAIWYVRPAVPAQVSQWIGDSYANLTPSTSCLNAAMSAGCLTTRIGHTGSVMVFENMNLVQYGRAGEGPFHMRLDNDEAPYFTAVCSSTYHNPGTWPDHAIDGHWGNALRIWMR